VYQGSRVGTWVEGKGGEGCPSFLLVLWQWRGLGEVSGPGGK